MSDDDSSDEYSERETKISSHPGLKVETLKYHSSICLRLLEELNPEILKEVNIDKCKEVFRNLMNISYQEKTNNPLVKITYEHESRAGHFSASGQVTFSEYIVALKCGKRWYFSDVLGKHSELDITIGEVEMEYVTHEEDTSDVYELDFEDDDKYLYDRGIVTEFRDKINEYIKTLDPVNLENFKEIYANKILKEGDTILNKLTITNDPTLGLYLPSEGYTREIFQSYPYGLPYDLKCVYKLKMSEYVVLCAAEYIFNHESRSLFSSTPESSNIKDYVVVVLNGKCKNDDSKYMEYGYHFDYMREYMNTLTKLPPKEFYEMNISSLIDYAKALVSGSDTTNNPIIQLNVKIKTSHFSTARDNDEIYTLKMSELIILIKHDIKLYDYKISDLKMRAIIGYKREYHNFKYDLLIKYKDEINLLEKHMRTLNKMSPNNFFIINYNSLMEYVRGL